MWQQPQFQQCRPENESVSIQSRTQMTLNSFTYLSVNWVAGVIFGEEPGAVRKRKPQNRGCEELTASGANCQYTGRSPAASLAPNPLCRPVLRREPLPSQRDRSSVAVGHSQVPTPRHLQDIEPRA